MENLTKTQIILLTLLVSFVTSLATGIVTVSLVNQAPPQMTQTISRVIEKTIETVVLGEPKIITKIETIILTEEDLIIKAVGEVLPAVVSIIATKDLPIIEQYFVDPFDNIEGFSLKIPQYRQKGTEKKQVSSGTGFLVSAEGIIVTNKHVVADTKAEYSIVLNDGETFSSNVLARDPTQDIAVLKIIFENEEDQRVFKYARLGDSDKIKIGQTAIAIGNTLGKFQNSVSTGIISGLNREIVASGPFGEELLSEVIQTDAAINLGNSGGPLLNTKGEVIGINTAVATIAENVGFALPINIIKRAVSDAIEFGEIRYAFLGVSYLSINTAVKADKELSVDYGALLVSDAEIGPAIMGDSPAEKAGLEEGDIILEFAGVKINSKNSLGLLISRHRVGEEIMLKILRGEEVTEGEPLQWQELEIKVILEERPKNI